MIPRDANGNLGQPTRFVGDAHAAGLKVHPHFRAENSFLPAEFRNADGNPQSRGDLAEIRNLDAGIDGLYDQPDVAVRLREQLTPDRRSYAGAGLMDTRCQPSKGLCLAFLQCLPPDVPADPPIALVHGVDRRVASGFHALVVA